MKATKILMMIVLAVIAFAPYSSSQHSKDQTREPVYSSRYHGHGPRIVIAPRIGFGGWYGPAYPYPYEVSVFPTPYSQNLGKVNIKTNVGS